MTDWNVPEIRDLLVEAGKIALQYFHAPETVHKHDTSLVTAGDHAVEAFLTEALAPGTDGTFFIGEESVGGTSQEEVDAALAGRTWVVDPIDGTAPYANRLPNWGISIGLLDAGRFAEGALFLPRSGELFITSGDSVLYQETSSRPDTWIFDDLTALPRTDHPYVSTGMISLPREVIRNGRFTGKNPIQSVGSAVWVIAKLIQGSYIGVITGLKLWDMAGSAPILSRMGFIVEYADGHRLGEKVLPTDWITDASNPRLWKCRGNLFIAQSEETLRFLHKHYRSDAAR
ncbi:MAG: inositol monophosphatase family protein [Alkalispirochaeta sp.]